MYSECISEKITLIIIGKLLGFFWFFFEGGYQRHGLAKKAKTNLFRRSNDGTYT